MFTDKLLSAKNLRFNFCETKNNVNDYFKYMEKLNWELARANIQKGLTTKYDFSTEYKKQPFIPLCKDDFGLSAKEKKEEQLKKLISNYYWAVSILSSKEQAYISERFINHKNENELIDILGYNSADGHDFRILKKSAIYKFADVLNMVVVKN